MIFDPEIYCTAAETAELDGTAPLALAGDGLWVGVLSRGACLLDGVDRPGQSGDILLGPAPLVLTPQSDCHLLARKGNQLRIHIFRFIRIQLVH